MKGSAVAHAVEVHDDLRRGLCQVLGFIRLVEEIKAEEGLQSVASDRTLRGDAKERQLSQPLIILINSNIKIQSAERYIRVFEYSIYLWNLLRLH